MTGVGWGRWFALHALMREKWPEKIVADTVTGMFGGIERPDTGGVGLPSVSGRSERHPLGRPYPRARRELQ